MGHAWLWCFALALKPPKVHLAHYHCDYYYYSDYCYCYHCNHYEYCDCLLLLFEVSVVLHSFVVCAASLGSVYPKLFNLKPCW